MFNAAEITTIGLVKTHAPINISGPVEQAELEGGQVGRPKPYRARGKTHGGKKPVCWPWICIEPCALNAGRRC